MRRKFQWMLSILAIAGISKAAAAKEQPPDRPNGHRNTVDVAINRLHAGGGNGPLSDGTTRPPG